MTLEYEDSRDRYKDDLIFNLRREGWLISVCHDEFEKRVDLTDTLKQTDKSR